MVTKKHEENTKYMRIHRCYLRVLWYNEVKVVIQLTLKELRISKGMSQVECAKFLGMSTRNYQNYENNADKSKTAKYHAIYQKLE